MYVPAHAPVQKDIAPLAELNRRYIERLGELVLRLCVEPRSLEDMLKLAFDDLGLELNFQQYVLAGSTLRSFLAWHLDAGRVSAEFVENRLIWKREFVQP